MRTLLWIIPAVAIALVGCHKNPDATAPQASPTGGETAPQASPTGGETAAAAAPPASDSGTSPNFAPTVPPPGYVSANADNFVRENVNGEPDVFLTSQLRVFIQQYNRMPQSFAEFAARRIDSMPRAPEGKKWVIDSTTQEVKAVSK